MTTVDLVLDLEQVKNAAEEACELMKVLSNPDRLLILCQLSKGDKNVSELEEILGITQPTLSQQLTVLRNKDLVTTERSGKNIYYRLINQKVVAVMKVLCADVHAPRGGQI